MAPWMWILDIIDIFIFLSIQTQFIMVDSDVCTAPECYGILAEGAGAELTTQMV